MNTVKKSTQSRKAVSTVKKEVKELPLVVESVKPNAKANLKNEIDKPIEFLKPEKPIKTISERLSRLKEFQKLADRHDQIEEKYEKMRLFKASSSGEDDVLTICSSSGEDFNTGSEKIIKEVLEIIVGNIEKARQKVKAEIEQFEI